jgi:hypothetical protein
MARHLLLMITLGAFGCQCEADSPDLIFDAGPAGPSIPECEGALVNDPVSGRCVPMRGVSRKCPDGAYDTAHPWAVDAMEAGAAVVYVAEGGTGSGSEADPMGDLGQALQQLQERGGLILLGEGSFTVGAQPLVTEPVTVVGRCSAGSNIGGQVGGRWNVNGFGENASMRLAGLRLKMGLKASNLRSIELNQLVAKAETGQRSQPGVEIRSDEDEGIRFTAHNVEISHWAQAVFATVGIAAVEISGSRMEQLGTGTIEVHQTIDGARVLINNNLLTTREDADVVVAVGKPQGLGATIDERESLVDTFQGEITIRDNTIRGLPDEAISRQRDDGAKMGVAVRYPRLSADNRIEIRGNSISDLRDAGIWLRQVASSAEGDETGSWWVLKNTIERVARGMVIDHITGNMAVSENAMVEPDGVGIALRYPGSGVSMDKNGVVSPGGRGYDLGPAKSPMSRISLSENQVSGAIRSGFYLRASGGGTWNLNSNTAHDCDWGFAVVGGTDGDDQSVDLTFSGNGVVALDEETHRVGIGVVDVKGDVRISGDRLESSRVGIWLERNHGGTITVSNPAMIRSGGASLLAIGNNSAIAVDELLIPETGSTTIAYDDLADGGGAITQVGLLLLDNREVSLVNVSALVNPLDQAIVVDRSALANEHYDGLDLETGASMSTQGLEGPDNSFRSADLNGLTIEGTGAARFVEAGDLPIARGWLRGAP